MCGRYTATDELSEFGSRIKFKPLQLALVPRYNVAPTQLAPVVVEEGGERVPRMMRWGLMPHRLRILCGSGGEEDIESSGSFGLEAIQRATGDWLFRDAHQRSATLYVRASRSSRARCTTP
jgi:SOS response associated peptidase (SRAP)